VTDELFDEFLKTDNRQQDRFDKLREAMQYLGLEKVDNETLTRYKELLTDKVKRAKHDNVLRLLRDEAYVQTKLAEARHNTFDVKVDRINYQKVALVRQLENTFGLVKFAGKNGDVDMDDGFYQKVRKALDTQKKKPTNYHELRQLYVNMPKHLSPDVVSTKKSRKKATRNMAEYSVNKEALVFHLTLHSYKDGNLNNFGNFARQLKGLPDKQDFDDAFLEEEPKKVLSVKSVLDETTVEDNKTEHYCMHSDSSSVTDEYDDVFLSK
jgi:hypothetical protein